MVEPEERVPEKDPKEKKLPVIEIFGPTIQGEGITIGQRTMFIRFGLCDYRCQMCDSIHAVDPKLVSAKARWMTQEEIFHEVVQKAVDNNCGWVTFSGGNPAIHNLENLIANLKQQGFGVNIETQGTLAPNWIQIADYITVSPKGPGMGEKFESAVFQRFIQKYIGHPGLNVKVVIFSDLDLEFASMVAEMCPSLIASDTFYLSLGNSRPPIPGQEIEPDLEELLDRYKQLFDHMKDYVSLKTARWLPQFHVLLWQNRQGV